MTFISQPFGAAHVAWPEINHIIRAQSKTFYFATALLPPRARRGIRALYAFCRATDDLVDCQNASLEDVERWRTEARCPAGEQRHPVLRAWAFTREQYAINPQYEQELLDGVQMDIRPRLYSTWAELERYCYCVASTVGLLSIPIVGLARGRSLAEAAPYAIALGIALQLTNILRDVGEDAWLGRVYLPQADLAQFSLTPTDILRQPADERFTALMQFEINRARALYRQALPGLRYLSLSARPAVSGAALLYQAILDEIEKLNYNVYHRRAHTTLPRKLALLPQVLATALMA